MKSRISGIGFILLCSFNMYGGESEVFLPNTLDLPTALVIAAENNLAIRQAKERIKEREGIVLEVKSSRKPQLEVSYNYTMFDQGRIEQFGGTSFGSDQSWTVGVILKQALYSAGGSAAQVSGMNDRTEAARLELLAVINDQLSMVRRQFYGVLLTKKKIEVQEQSLELLEEQLKTVTDRYAAGSVSNFEKLRAEVAVANGQPALIRARKDFYLAWEELRYSLGFDTAKKEHIRKRPKIKGKLRYSERSIDLWTVIQTARANRNELKQLREIEEAASQHIKVKKSNYYPDMGVFFGYQTKKSDFSDELDDVVKGWAMGVEGDWSIFDGFRTKSKLIQARSIFNQAKLSTREKLQEIEKEVQLAYYEWQEADELVKVSVLVVDQAEEAVRLADSRFSSGVATQLDVLQSRVELTKARTNRIEALYQFNVSIANLYKSTGQGGSLK